jgi:hypothetical protein
VIKELGECWREYGRQKLRWYGCCPNDLPMNAGANVCNGSLTCP